MDDSGNPPDTEDAGEQAKPVPTYEVGYKRPPREHQFPRQTSGNPRGRPKGAKGLRAELKEELDEMVSITVDGKRRRVRKRRLIIKALAREAANGNVRAADRLLALVIQAEGFEDQRPATRRLADADKAILERLLETEPAVLLTTDKETPAEPTTDLKGEEE